MILTTAMALAWSALAGSAIAGTICTALQDVATGAILSAEGDCSRRVTPASTFKIAISLMGYDAGVLKDAHHPARPYDESYKAWRPEWKTTTDPTTWIAKSVVWYSQQTTTALGAARFGGYVRDFQYGDQDVSGGLARAWLSSSLHISPMEQLDFLRRMLLGRLPVSRRAVDMTAQITAMPDLIDGWTIHGKTGSGAPHTADGGYDGGREFGWFVGWAIKDGRKVVFARLIQADGPANEPMGMRARREMLAALPVLLSKTPR